MFSKRRLQIFTYYYHLHNDERWENDLRELHENGMRYIVISEGFDLKNILATEDQKSRLIAFLDVADAQGIRCILNPGNPKDLYLLPDARRWRVDYIRHVAEILGDHPAVYGLLLEDAPDGGARFGMERWKSVTEELEGRLESRDLTTDGYRCMVKSWQMDQYADYIAELNTVVKKTHSGLKTAISFHMDALFPHDTFVHFQKTAQFLDFVIIDAGAGWLGDPREGRYLTRFVTDVATGLTDKDVWVVVGSHVDHSRYQSGIREIREWTRQALDLGAVGIGWHGWDTSHWSDRYPVRGVPFADSKPEHWAAILTLARSLTDQTPPDIDPAPQTCLFSYDSLINHLTATDYFAPNLILGEESRLPLSYTTDTQIISGKGLQKLKFLITTPSPSVRVEMTEPVLKFMQNGGWVIASGDDCALDEQLRPSDARSRLFGIQEEKRLIHDDRILLDVDLTYLPGAVSLSTAWQRIALMRLDEDVRVLGRWGDHTPAIILKPHGRGGALYIGTDPYRAAMWSDGRADWSRFLRSVVDPYTLKNMI